MKEDAFVISPMKQEIVLTAGETYEGSILIAVPTTATENFTYKISVKPFNVSGTDYKPDFETISDWSKIVEWIEVPNETDTLAPNDSKRIYFKIKVPETAPAGGQYAMIGVSSVPNSTSSTSEIRDVYTIGSLIYAKVDGETIHQGKILDNHISGFVASGVPSATITVTNEGNVHETLETSLEVKNFFTGESVAISKNDDNDYETLIMPESTRVVSRDLEGLPSLGIFQVTQDASYLDGVSSVTTVLVVCPIWFITLVFLLTISIIAGVVVGIFKKYQKSSKKQLHFDNADDKMDL